MKVNRKNEEKIMSKAEAFIRKMGVQNFIKKYPESLIDPVSTVDKETLGMHQDSHWFFQPYETVILEGKTLYVFDSQITEE